MMKIKFYILLLFPTYLISQTSYEREWATYYANNFESDLYVSGAFTDQERNLFVSTNTSTDTTNQSRILKFSASGNLLWDFNFNNEPNYSLNIDDLAMDNDGNLVFCGYTNSTDNIATSNAWQNSIAGGYDRFLGKLNNMGELIWCTYFGGLEDDILTEYDLNASNIQITAENDIIWQSPIKSTGLGTPDVFQPTRQGANNMISKFSADGQRVWTTYYGADELYSIHSHMVVSDSAIFVAGTSLNEIYFDTFGDTWLEGASSNYFISSFDFNGNRNWSRYFGGNENVFEQRNNLAILGKDLFFTGWTSTSNLGTPNSYNPTLPEYQGSNFLSSFGEMGYENWTTYLGETSNNLLNSGAEFSTLSSNNLSVFVSGGSTKDAMISTPGSFQEDSMGNTDAYIMEFSPNGTLKWGSYYGGNGFDHFVITAPFDGGFYLLGSTDSTSDISTPGAYQEEFSGNGRDIFIVKFVEENLGVTDENQINTTFSIYPNPAKDVVQVKINNMQAEKVHIRLFSINGKLLKNKTVSSSSIEIDVRGLTSGSYVIVIENGNKISSQKLLIQ